MFVKAQRRRAKARIGLVGPAGSGKTYSALLLAFGLVGTEGKVALLDTEHGSGSLYADIGNYDVSEISAPFTVDRYLQGIRTAEEAGYDCLVIDSLSHAWAGEGGLLELVDNVTASKNKFTAWRDATPKHNALVEAMLQSSLHIIATMRAKTEYVLSEQNGKQVPKKVGMAPVQREGMDYEFSLVFDIEQGKHVATTSKDRTSLFDGFYGKLAQEHGRMVKEWLEAGVEISTPTVPPHQTTSASTPGTAQTALFISKSQISTLESLIRETGADQVRFLKYLGVARLDKLPLESYQEAILALEAKKDFRPHQANRQPKNFDAAIAALAAKRIEVKVDEAAKVIYASSFKEKEFLKALGFRWDTTAKSWVLQAA